MRMESEGSRIRREGEQGASTGDDHKQCTTDIAWEGHTVVPHLKTLTPPTHTHAHTHTHTHLPDARPAVLVQVVSPRTTYRGPRRPWPGRVAGVKVLLTNGSSPEREPGEKWGGAWGAWAYHGVGSG